MKRVVVMCSVLGCQPAAPVTAPLVPVEQTGPSPAASSALPAAGAVPGGKLGAPLTGPPRLVVENHSTVDIDIYGAYLVDEGGALGTMKLWPHSSDCPEVERDHHIVPKGGIYEMPPPTRPYDSDQCAPGSELKPGRYLLRIESGYGKDLYGFARLELPLAEPVRLPIVNHGEEPWACDSTKAQRAARLVFTAMKEVPGLPKAFLDGCDIERAGCGTLPLEETPPPPACTVALHEDLLRIDRPAGDDAIRGVTAWTDREVVYARKPEVSLTSASALQLGGKTVVLEGLTSHHSHAHGGAAASIGEVTLRVHNPLGRALNYAVQGVDWLVDHSCELPTRVLKRPAVKQVSSRTLPPGRSELEISFESQGAYMAHCDRFASRVRLRVEGRLVTVTAEHEVTRYEPLRE